MSSQDPVSAGESHDHDHESEHIAGEERTATPTPERSTEGENVEDVADAIITDTNDAMELPEEYSPLNDDAQVAPSSISSDEWRRALRHLRYATAISVGASPACVAASSGMISVSAAALDVFEEAVEECIAHIRSTCGAQPSATAPLPGEPCTRGRNGTATNPSPTPFIPSPAKAAAASQHAVQPPLLYSTPDGKLRAASVCKRTTLLPPKGADNHRAHSPDGLNASANVHSLVSKETRTPKRGSLLPSKATVSPSYLVNEFMNEKGLLVQLLKFAWHAGADGVSVDDRAEALFTLVYAIQILLLPYLAASDPNSLVSSDHACGSKPTHGEEEADAKLRGSKGGLMSDQLTHCHAVSLLRLEEVVKIASALLLTTLDSLLFKQGSPEAVNTLLLITNAFYLLVGCADPSHWDEEHLTSGDVAKARLNHTRRAAEKRASPSKDHAKRDSIAESGFFFSFTTLNKYIAAAKDTPSYAAFIPSAGYAGCLCANSNVVVYRVVMDHLRNSDTWTYLWKYVVMTYLPHCEADVNSLSVMSVGEADISPGYMSIERTIATRFVLKLMTQLLLQCGYSLSWHAPSESRDTSTVPDEDDASVVDEHAHVAANTATRNEPFGDMEILLWGKTGNDVTLSQQLRFTIARLSDFLQYSRMSCYAANVLHVLLSRIYAMPSSCATGVSMKSLLTRVFLREGGETNSRASEPRAENPMSEGEAAPNNNSNNNKQQPRAVSSEINTRDSQCDADFPPALANFSRPLSDPLRDTVHALAMQMEMLTYLYRARQQNQNPRFRDIAALQNKKPQRIVSEWEAKNLFASVQAAYVQHAALLAVVLLIDQKYLSCRLKAKLRDSGNESYKQLLALSVGSGKRNSNNAVPTSPNHSTVSGAAAGGEGGAGAEEPLSLQTLLSSGLARTLQVILLQCTTVEHVDPTSPYSLPPSFLRVENDNVVALATTVTPNCSLSNAEIIAAMKTSSNVDSVNWADTLTLTAYATPKRSQVALGTLSSVVCCPLKPILASSSRVWLESVEQGKRSVKGDPNSMFDEAFWNEHVPSRTAGVPSSSSMGYSQRAQKPFDADSPDPIQVFVRVPSEDTKPEPSAMIFEMDQLSFHERLKKVQDVGRKFPMKHHVQTVFVDRSGLDYAQVLSDARLFPMFEREVGYLTTSIDMVVLSPTERNSKSSSSSSSVSALAAPFIVASAAQYADEIVLWSKPSAEKLKRMADAAALASDTVEDRKKRNEHTNLPSTALTVAHDTRAVLASLPAYERRRLAAAVRGLGHAAGQLAISGDTAWHPDQASQREQVLHTAALIGPRPSPSLETPQTSAVFVGYAKKPPHGSLSWAEWAMTNQGSEQARNDGRGRFGALVPVNGARDRSRSPQNSKSKGPARPVTAQDYFDRYASGDGSIPPLVDFTWEPVDVADIAVQRKDEEIRLLKAEMAALQRENTETERRFQEASETRTDLLQRMTSLRLELQLCQDDIILPLRTEVHQYRKQVALKNRELSTAMNVVRSLQQENDAMRTALESTKHRMESLFAILASKGGVVAEANDVSPAPKPVVSATSNGDEEKDRAQQADYDNELDVDDIL